MTDNGAAMTAEETTAGLAHLGILHQTTLPYSPYQNAKQEAFWGRLEGRLMAMLEGCEQLTLEYLNLATQAWVEQEYHRSQHGEIGTTPLARYLEAPTCCALVRRPRFCARPCAPARYHRGGHQSPAEQHRRLLPGVGRHLWCAATPVKPLGWLQGPARALGRASGVGPNPNGAAHRRSPGDEPRGALGTSPAGGCPIRFPAAAVHYPGR